MKYARIENGIVAEVVELPEGFTLKECFHASLIDKFKPCGDEVAAGWIHEGILRFSAPPEPEPTTAPEAAPAA